MIVLGLTGGIGSGKSTIARYFREKKIPVFDSDKEVNKIYLKKDKDLLGVIAKISGINDVIISKKIDKKKLGDLVFSSPKKLNLLEKTIFKKLKKTRKEFLAKNKKNNKKIVVLDTPLLFENKINFLCHYVVTTKAPMHKRIFRILKRSGMTKIKAKNIIAKQMSEKKKQKLANFVVQTAKGKYYTKKSIDKILLKILKKNKK